MTNDKMQGISEHINEPVIAQKNGFSYSDETAWYEYPLVWMLNLYGYEGFIVDGYEENAYEIA